MLPLATPGLRPRTEATEGTSGVVPKKETVTLDPRGPRAWEQGAGLTSVSRGGWRT